MTIDDFLRNIQRAKNTLVNKRSMIALQAANDMNATVKLRIQEKGENAFGTQFSPYTPQYAKKGRKEKGYQDNYVDFTRTGRLMANIQPQVLKSTNSGTDVVITARSAKEKAKLAGQYAKRGNIIYPSIQETLLLRKQYGQRVLNMIESIV